MQFDPTIVLGPQDRHCYKQLCKAGLKVNLPTLGELLEIEKANHGHSLTNSNTDESRPIQHACSN
jgi:hypothetical protein